MLSAEMARGRLGQEALARSKRLAACAGWPAWLAACACTGVCGGSAAAMCPP